MIPENLTENLPVQDNTGRGGTVCEKAMNRYCTSIVLSNVTEDVVLLLLLSPLLTILKVKVTSINKTCFNSESCLDNKVYHAYVYLLRKSCWLSQR